MIFVFLFLTYFTLYDRLGPSMSLQMTQYHSLLWVSNIPLCICATAYPFNCWWTSRLLPCPGYYKQRCNESVSGHSHCFYVLGIANSAIVNTGVHVAFWIMVFSRSLLYFNCHFIKQTDFPGGSDGKASASSAGDPGSIPGSGRSPGKGNGNPLQYYCLENPMDKGAW